MTWRNHNLTTYTTHCGVRPMTQGVRPMVVAMFECISMARIAIKQSPLCKGSPGT